MQWVRDLYDWVLKWSESKYGTVALVVMAFAEASFFPIPPDILLIALALGARKKAIRYGILCSLGSIVGAMFGFGIGYFLWWSNPVNFPGWLNSFLILFLALPKTFFTEFRNNIMRGIFG